MTSTDLFTEPAPLDRVPTAYSRDQWLARAAALRPRTDAVIDGRMVPALTGRTYEDRTPRDGSLIASVAECDSDDAARAVAAARAAFDDGRWSDLAPADRKRDVKKSHRFARRLRAGTVWVNTFDSADHTVPFGGCKQSGFGRDKSLHALDGYTQLKTTWLDLGE